MARSQSGVRKAGGTVLSFEEWEALVRGWKGAASSVLWVLMARGEAHPANGARSANGMTAVQLERATGYSDKPVRQALAKLEGMGLVAHDGRARGWEMSKKGRREME